MTALQLFESLGDLLNLLPHKIFINCEIVVFSEFVVNAKILLFLYIRKLFRLHIQSSRFFGIPTYLLQLFAE